MCLPIFIPIGAAIGASAANAAAVGTMIAASVAIAGASAGLQFAGQRQQANSQEEMYALTQKNAHESLKNDYAQTAVRLREEQAAAAQQLQTIEQQSRAALSRGQVAAGEAGVAGTNYDILMDDFKRQQLTSQRYATLNYEARRNQIAYGQMGARSQAFNQMVQAYPTVGQPSMLAPFLQVGGAAINSAAMFYTPGTGGSGAPQNGGSGFASPFQARNG
jgi:hypothetical protein